MILILHHVVWNHWRSRKSNKSNITVTTVPADGLELLDAWTCTSWVQWWARSGLVFYPWLSEVSANERRRYLCNVFSLWLRPCSATDRKWTLVLHKYKTAIWNPQSSLPPQWHQTTASSVYKAHLWHQWRILEYWHLEWCHNTVARGRGGTTCPGNKRVICLSHKLGIFLFWSFIWGIQTSSTISYIQHIFHMYKNNTIHIHVHIHQHLQLPLSTCYTFHFILWFSDMVHIHIFLD